MNKVYDKKWFMLDLARHRSFNRNEVKTLLEVLSRCGYNGIALLSWKELLCSALGKANIKD